jgi:mannose-6-phosphate isomerase-like protein (cupin superfamily)
MHDGEPLVETGLRAWRQVGRATGAQAISLSVMEFAPGMSPTIKNDDCDQILYVLSYDREAVDDSSQGQARNAPPLVHELSSSMHPEGVRETPGATEIIIDGYPWTIGQHTGIYVHPHQTFAINNAGARPITVISSQCPDPDRGPQSTTDARAPVSPGTNIAPIVRLADQKAQPTADRWYRVLIDERVGSTQVTQFVGSIPPGRAPDHFHNYEEVLFILKGEGRMWASETNTSIGTGSCIYLPKGQVHCVENTGEGELRLLGVFYPAGSPSVRYDA